MTPDDEIHTLKALLGRIRRNSDGRLAVRSGDEEEFVPRSVREARARAEAELAAPTEGPGGDGVGEPPEELPVASSEPPSIELASSPPLELDLFDPFEDEPFDEPPQRSEAPEPAASRVVATAAPPALFLDVGASAPSTPLLELGFDDADEADGDDLVEAMADDLLAEAEDVLDDEALDDRVLGEEPLAHRAVDPLATTAQNPLPAAMFEQAVLDDAMLADARLDHAMFDEESVDRPLPRVEAKASDHREEQAPTSSPRPVDPDEQADAGLESEPPPESGEMASQRHVAPAALPAAASRPRDLDLDAPTASSAEGARLARALDERVRVEEALQPEVVTAAPPPARPAVIGRSALRASSFLEVLDAALAFGEDPPPA